jgi:hypothetical protein
VHTVRRRTTAVERGSRSQAGAPRTGVRLLILIALFASTLLAFGCGDTVEGPDRAIAATANGRILFIQHGDIAVWENGKTRRLLQLGDAAWARWSPDGRRIAFVRLGDAYSDLYIADTSTGEIRQLTRNRPPFTPGSVRIRAKTPSGRSALPGHRMANAWFTSRIGTR